MPRKTETTSQDLHARMEAARTRIAELRDERRAVDQAPVTRAEAEAAVDAWIAARRQAAIDIVVGSFLRGDTSGQLLPRDDQPLQGAVNGTSCMIPAPNRLPRVEATLVALMPEQVRALLMAEVDRQLADQQPMSAEARQAERERIDTEIWTQGQVEEAAIRELEALGERPLRRPDADPRIILDLAEPPAPLPRPQRAKPIKGRGRMELPTRERGDFVERNLAARDREFFGG